MPPYLFIELPFTIGSKKILRKSGNDSQNGNLADDEGKAPEGRKIIAPDEVRGKAPTNRTKSRRDDTRLRRYDLQSCRYAVVKAIRISA